MANPYRKKESRSVAVQRNALESNEMTALRNRAIFGKSFVMNFLSSPGSGKTSLLETIIPLLTAEGVNAAVIEGDVDTDLDKKRIDALNVPAYQIVTNGTCHLDARMVNNSLERLDVKNADVIFIENVGNLVCPTSYNLGEDMKVVVLSVTEGDDKPLKYPAAFYKSAVLIINKIDLLPFLNSDISKITDNALSINKNLKVFKTSCYNGKTHNQTAYIKTPGGDVSSEIDGFVAFIKNNIKLKSSQKKAAALNSGMGI